MYITPPPIEWDLRKLQLAYLSLQNELQADGWMFLPQDTSAYPAIGKLAWHSTT